MQSEAIKIALPENPWKLKITEAKVGNGLHLTQVPWAAINDPCVGATFFGIHHHFSSSGKRTKFGPRNHS